MGKGDSVDFKVQDVSVSKAHAIMEVTSDKNICLKDNKSRFGTLKLIQEPYLIEDSLSL